MVLFGTIINGISIIVGSLLGLMFTSIPERIKETVMQAIGLIVLLMGLQMAFMTENIMIILISLLLGALLGECLRIEHQLERFGGYVGRLMSKEEDSTFSFADGFVAATLLFAVGAMAVLGALDSGVRNDHEVLLTKAAIDGFTALVLTSTLGIGVLFSFIPVVLYQGSIALLATQIERLIPANALTSFMNELTAVGGLLIVAIALNLLKLTNIRIANLLPAVIIVGFVCVIAMRF